MFFRLLSMFLLAPLTSRLRTRASMDSSISAAQIVVEYDGVDGGGGAVGKSVKKSVKKSSKGQRIVKKSEKPLKV